MITYAHILYAVIAACFLAIWVLWRRHLRYWLRGVRYAHTGHHQAPARKDPVWDDDEPADTWAGDIAASIRAEECADPDCSQMTHTGNMPKLRPGPDWWEPLRPTVTVPLPPWPVGPITPDVLRDRYESVGGTVTDLPGPAPDEGAVVPGGVRGPVRRAGKPRNTWTGLLGRPDPQNLPAAATPSPAAHGPDKSAGPSDGGEPDVIEGVVVTGPPPVTLGYIEGLALSPAYYQRLDQIGAQARVLALEAAA